MIKERTIYVDSMQHVQCFCGKNHSIYIEESTQEAIQYAREVLLSTARECMHKQSESFKPL